MATTTTIRLGDMHLSEADDLIDYVTTDRLAGANASRSDVLRFAIAIGLKQLRTERARNSRSSKRDS